MKNTKEHILKATTKLFLQKSFKEVTMKEIVQTTGMSKGAFYHHFSSKDQLFLEIAENFFILAQVDFDTFSEESLFEFYHQYLDRTRHFVPVISEWFSDSNKAVSINFYILMFDAMNRYPGFKKKLIKRQQIENETWRKIIAIAREKGEIRSSMTDEQITKLFCYIPDGAGLNKLIMGRFESSEDEIRNLYDGLYEQLKS